MSIVRWEPQDVSELIARDRRRILRDFTPLTVAVGLLALWVFRTEPLLGALFGGMCAAWVWSLAWSFRAVGRQWRAFVRAQPKDAEVQVGAGGVSWSASYGSRALRWEGVVVRKIGGTWTFEVGGREVAYLAAGGLDPRATEELRKRDHDTTG